MAKEKAKPEDADKLLGMIEDIIMRLMKLDTMPHKEQMELLDRALKLAEIKKKAPDTAFGSGFND